MPTISIMDPVTRIEGHLRVDVTIDTKEGQLQVVDAHCRGTLFRGFEAILQGRDPWDAPILTQRICGVCSVSHCMASVKTLESNLWTSIPANARILRNLVLGSNFLQSHILHFYLLAALDFLQIDAAPWTPAWEVDMRPGLDGVGSHLPQALEARRRTHEMGAIFGGRMPSPNTYIPGGFTAIPDSKKINAFQDQLDWLDPFIESIYIPDVQSIAEVYNEYYEVGQGVGRLLAFGVFDQDDSALYRLFPGGIASIQNGAEPSPVEMNTITEAVRYSWYKDSQENFHPSKGTTQPLDPQTKPEAYSWLKSPRYNGLPYEAGPLARMWMAGEYWNGVSVMDRHYARALECRRLVKAMHGWLKELRTGDSVYTPVQRPRDGFGVGLTEAPRGALGHWAEFSNGRIANYQIVTPTCWNASPRDDKGEMGPMEQALLGTPIQNPEQPIEALRVIHSFDPCLACAVHVMRPDGKAEVIQTGI